MALSPLQAFELYLQDQEEKILKALPSHVSVKRFIASTVSHVSNNPKILECDHGSIIQCIMRAAQMGLIIDGVEAALVPRKTKCTLMVMVQGLLKLVRNSGELKDIQSAVVYEKDEFDYYTDETGEHLKHRRTWGDRGERRLVFAIARTKEGGVFVEVMDAGQVDAVRKQGYDSAGSPWNGPFQDEMWRKSAIRRLSKRLPSSTDMESFSQGVHADDDLFVPQEDEQPPKSEPETTSSRLAEKVAPEPEPAPKPEPEPQLERKTVSGIIHGITSKQYGDVTRIVATIGDVKCGTTDDNLSKTIKTAYQFKGQVVIVYEEHEKYNEIVEIKGQQDAPI